MSGFRRLCLVVAVLAAAVTAYCQDPTVPVPVPQPGGPLTQVELLRSKLERRTRIEKEIGDHQLALVKSPAPAEKARLDEELKQLQENRDLLDMELRRDMSGGSEVTIPPDSGDLDLQKQMKDVLKPALDFLNDMMKQPREIEQLRRDRDRRDMEIAAYQRGIDGLTRTLAAVNAETNVAVNEPLRAELKRLRDDYERKRSVIENERNTIQRRLDELLKERKGFGHYAASLWSGYVLQRLLNLLYAIIAFVGVLLLFHWLRKWLSRRGLRKRFKASAFLARATDVVFYILSGIGAVFAAFVVLWIAGDWLLLTLGMLLVAGLVLVSRHTLPRLYEDVRIVMNLGGVREGERVTWRGLPWLVKRLHFYSDLHNPSLTGGSVRLPLKEMGALLSRPFGQKERWFPTEEGEWVELSDGTVGKIVLQTPESVQIVLVGGSFKTYTTTDFLTKTPRNLSHNFRIQSRFCLDYRHVGEILGEAPATLAAALRQGYRRLVEGDDILRVNVELVEAGNSSLDLAVLADFSGNAAPQYAALQRLTQRLCMETAAANNWTVPFRQVVVHRADDIDTAAAVEVEP